jgi:hypothetical protein
MSQKVAERDHGVDLAGRRKSGRRRGSDRAGAQRLGPQPDVLGQQGTDAGGCKQPQPSQRAGVGAGPSDQVGPARALGGEGQRRPPGGWLRSRHQDLRRTGRSAELLNQLGSAAAEPVDRSVRFATLVSEPTKVVGQSARLNLSP